MKTSTHYTSHTMPLSFGQKYRQKDELPNSNIYYFKEGNNLIFDKYEIKNPQGILKDLNQAKNELGYRLPYKFFQNLIDYINSSGNYKNEKLYGIIGLGHFSAAFDIGNNKIIKMSRFNPLEFRPYNKNFDIPFLSPVEKFKDSFICLQAKADTEKQSFLDVLKVKMKMRQQGYQSTFDFDITRTDQVGKYNGKSYLLDTRCAIPKTNTFTRVVLFLRNYLDTDLNKELQSLNLYDYFQREEQPIKNITKKEGWKILKKIAKSWF